VSIKVLKGSGARVLAARSKIGCRSLQGWGGREGEGREKPFSSKQCVLGM